MRVNWVRAEIECDTCGKPFQVKIDEGMLIGNFDDMMEIAEDAVRAGYTPHGGIVDMCSMQHDMALCAACTTKVDAIGDEDYEPTRDEIIKATRTVEMDP